jgi:hypothetical protein
MIQVILEEAICGTKSLSRSSHIELQRLDFSHSAQHQFAPSLKIHQYTYE